MTEGMTKVSAVTWPGANKIHINIASMLLNTDRNQVSIFLRYIIFLKFVHHDDKGNEIARSTLTRLKPI